MKRNSIFNFSVFTLALFMATSCLDGNQVNFPAGAGGGTFLTLEYNAGAGSANTNAGLTGTFFSNCALLFPGSKTSHFGVTLQGPNLTKDVNVTVGIDTTIAHRWDNLANDSIYYLPMPASAYSFSSNTGVIKAGERYVEFTLTVDPTQLDGTKSYMLPITATNSEGVLMADNFKWIYIHTIGNPLAGAVTWDFLRCSDPACSAGLDGQTFYGHNAAFAPISGTSYSVPTGYYTQPNYIVTFNDDGAGNLTSFKVALDPVEINGTWANAGITVATGPTILVENETGPYTKFTMHYTTATRNCTDIYHR